MTSPPDSSQPVFLCEDVFIAQTRDELSFFFFFLSVLVSVRVGLRLVTGVFVCVFI